MNIDLLSLAGNMFYGPKGSAALYIRKGIAIRPLLDGGIQERGKRAGTENVPAIIGMGVAAEIAVKEMDNVQKAPQRTFGKLMDGLRKRIEYLAELRTSGRNRHPGIVSVGAEFVEGESILLFMGHGRRGSDSFWSCAAY